MTAIWIIASFIMLANTEPPREWFEARCKQDGGVLQVQPGVFPVDGKVYKGHWYTCAPIGHDKPKKLA